MCSLPGPQDSFLQHDQNLFPYTSCPNADFMAPWVLLTEKPCITAMKSEGKNPLSRHVVFRVNASCAALTLKAFSVRHPEQREALITRHPSSSSQRFLKPPSFSPFQSSQRLQPLGGQWAHVSLSGSHGHLWDGVVENTGISVAYTGYTFVPLLSATREFLSPAPVIPSLGRWPWLSRASSFHNGQSRVYKWTKQINGSPNSKLWSGPLHNRAEVLSHCPLSLDYSCHSSYFPKSLRVYGWCGWIIAQVTQPLQLRIEQKSC